MKRTQTDCLIIGFNDTNFQEFVGMIKALGTDSGAYRDLNLAFIDYDNKSWDSMALLNHLYAQGRPGHKPFHNSDFLWPVVTYMGSYLARRGFTFDYVNLFQLEKEKLKEKLLHDEILTIAITTTLYVSPFPIMEIVSFIKQYNQTAKLVIGGPYVSNQFKMLDETTLKQVLKFLGADIYVNSSEGELALVNAISALKNGLSLDRVENIAYKQNGDYVMTAQSIESNSLEENMVQYGIFPREDFGEFATLRTAKSCPFSCSFCGFPQRAGKYTYLPVGYVEQELNQIRDIGTVNTLTFIDDTFNVPKGRFKEMLRMMIRNRYGFKWNSYLRSDHVDEEAIQLMKESGCEGVFLGVESGSDKMLERMYKTSRRKDYLRVVPQLKEAGIVAHASLIIGFPGETQETVQETIDFIEEAAPDFFRAQLWYCDPTTPIWNDREKYGIKGSAFNWVHDTMDLQTACEIVDHMFLSVKNSVWLPQNGFEMWSLFYLQRKGITLPQITEYLNAFNALIKEKLANPGKPGPSPSLIENVSRCSLFNRAAGEHN